MYDVRNKSGSTKMKSPQPVKLNTKPLTVFIKSFSWTLGGFVSLSLFVAFTKAHNTPGLSQRFDASVGASYAYATGEIEYEEMMKIYRDNNCTPLFPINGVSSKRQAPGVSCK